MAYRLNSDESVPEGIRRIAGEQLDRAIQHLESQEGSRDKHVHEARKSMKRMRALLRLVREEIGPGICRRENDCFRDVALQLAGMRDATVLINSLDELVANAGTRMRRDRFATGPKWLVERREGAYQPPLEEGDGTRTVIDDLRWARARVAEWPLAHDGWKGLEGGVQQVYTRGRSEFEKACIQAEEEMYHDWRKWAKYLWYHTQLLREIWPPLMDVMAGELDELGEVLGQDHDLSVLRSTVLGEMDRPIRATTLQGLLELIEERQGQLRVRAERLGRRIYVEGPRDFTRRLRGYWRAWRVESRPEKSAIMHSERKSMEPELIADYNCMTGEGPLWNPQEKRLYWVDIPNGRLFRYDPAVGQHEQVYEGEEIGGFTIQEDGQLLLFMARGAVALWRNGIQKQVIEEIEAERDSRFNDVMADPEGRVFCGTMPVGERLGRLYRLDADGTLTQILDGIGCSNGMGFTPDRTQMYYTDSGAKKIYLFDYDREGGGITNQRVFVDSGDLEGVPDGMTVDAEGYVWSARWDGGCLIRYTPEGQEERRVAFPARKVSCVTFGGDDYTDMYVTTAGGGNKEEEGTGAGGLFRINLGIKGVPEFFSRVGI
ncbi:MAG: CHAD domain-containing protein [Gemmatimonadetes bacterium]|nr:CHAD domain-containing protein [Gemmatimonadota bacterium]